MLPRTGMKPGRDAKLAVDRTQAGLGQVLGEVGITAEHHTRPPGFHPRHLLRPRWKAGASALRWESGQVPLQGSSTRS